MQVRWVRVYFRWRYWGHGSWGRGVVADLARRFRARAAAAWLRLDARVCVRPKMVPREFRGVKHLADESDESESKLPLSDTTVFILEAAAKFLFTDDLQGSLAAFCANHASMFLGTTGLQGEQRLEWSEAHANFQQLFEFHLEQFVEHQPFGAADFVAACQEALDRGTWANCRGLVQTVLSMTSYEYFVRMMTTAANEEEAASTAPLGPAHGEPGYTRDMLALALDMD